MQRKIELTLQTAALPDGIDAVCQQRGQDQYLMILRNNQTDDEQAASFLHECLHVLHDDFNSSLPVDVIEAQRHAELKRIIRLLQKER